MQTQILSTVAVALGVVLCTPSFSHAQDRQIASPALVQQTLQHKSSSDADARASIRRALARPDAIALATRLGLDVKSADARIATLSGDALARAAASVNALESPMAGAGSQTIVISTTTLLLALILIVLLIN